MMEFVMSKVWMFIAALALTIAVVGAFNDLDRSALEQATMGKAENFGDLIEELERSRFPVEITISGNDLLFDDSTSLNLRNGSIWVSRGQMSRALTFPKNVTYLDEGEVVDQIIVRHGDALRVSCTPEGNGFMHVQLEKVDATCFTASTNLLHSSTLLYR